MISPKIPLDSYESFCRHLGDREYFGQKLGLERIQKLLRRLGNPEKDFKSIHIAGTNGKGSTAAMLASVLQKTGLKTGLYTSPHLHDFCERIRVGAELISQEDVLLYARRIREVEEEPLTFFELTTAMAFLYFSSQKVEMAVIETGLGGRLDATNVITPLVSVITTLSRDHTEHLGETIEAIAFEKGGIIKPGIPVVTGLLPTEAKDVILRLCTERNSPWLPVLESIPKTISLTLAGSHQIKNAAVALRVLDLLIERYHFTITREVMQEGLASVSWPGRLETVSLRPWILLDGAHNAEAMQTVFEFVRDHLEGRRLTTLFGAMGDKNIEDMLRILAPITDEFVFTTSGLKRAATPESLRARAEIFKKPCIVEPDMVGALERTLSKMSPEGVLLATGSLVLVGGARQWLENFTKS